MKFTRLNRVVAGCVAAALVALPPSASACSVCFGKTDSPLLKGMQMGVLALLLVVAFVLGGCAAFFIYLARRAAAVAEPPAPDAVGTESVSSPYE